MEIKQPQAWGYDGGFDVPVTENRYENTYTGWWYTDPSEKYESQLGWWHSQYMEK